MPGTHLERKHDEHNQEHLCCPQNQGQKKASMRLIKNEKARLTYQAAKASAVSQNAEVISRMVEDYKNLPRVDQKLSALTQN
jgi:hypothetical protein